MNEILSEFLEDINSIKLGIDLIEVIKLQQSINEQIEFNPINDLALKEHLITLTVHARECHLCFNKMEGTLVLYIAGRFENFVRSIFEDACQNIASNCGEYKKLPKEMKENLVKYTAEVMSSPRKYRQGDSGVAAFVKNLSENLSSNSIDNINYQCMSITIENMRPGVMQELFQRFGLKRFWETISEQANFKIYFSSNDKSYVEKLAKAKLEDLMELRNSIAHPSNDITWPDEQKIKDYIDYLKILAEALVGVVSIHVATCPAVGDSS